MMKGMRDAFVALLRWVGARASWVLLWVAMKIDHQFGERALVFVSHRNPAALKDFVEKRAHEMALGYAMATLDREGIAHCVLCPRRFSLKKVGGLYACLNHLEEVTAKLAKAAA
jgi:hypothetical protein